MSESSDVEREVEQPSDSDRFFAIVQGRIPEPLTSDEKRDLKSLLFSELFLKTVTILYIETKYVGTAMIKLDLGTEEGRHEGSKMQGRANGVVRFLEGLVVLTEQETEDE